MDRDTPTPPIVERYFYGEYYKCPSCWRGTYEHEEKQESKASSRVDLREMQDILGKLLRNLCNMQVVGVAYERGREKDYEQARDGVIA